MNKNTLIICTFLISFVMLGQQRSKEKIKAFKIAYITEELDLNSTEAQTFWPIYNSYQNAQKELRKKERKMAMNLRESNNGNTMNESQASKLITSYVTIETQKLNERKQLYDDLKTILSNQKILKLIHAEIKFKRKLIQKLRKQQYKE